MNKTLILSMCILCTSCATIEKDQSVLPDNVILTHHLDQFVPQPKGQIIIDNQVYTITGNE